MAGSLCQYLLVIYFFVISIEYTLTAPTDDDVLETVKAEESVYLRACQKELNVAKEDVEGLISNKIGTKLSRGTKCLRACIGEKLKVIDSDGKLISDAVEQLFMKSFAKVYKSPKGWVASIAEKCNKQSVKGDKCETVSSVTECVVLALMEKVKGFKNN